MLYYYGPRFIALHVINNTQFLDNKGEDVRGTFSHKHSLFDRFMCLHAGAELPETYGDHAGNYEGDECQHSIHQNKGHHPHLGPEIEPLFMFNSTRKSILKPPEHSLGIKMEKIIKYTPKI